MTYKNIVASLQRDVLRRYGPIFALNPLSSSLCLWNGAETGHGTNIFHASRSMATSVKTRRCLKVPTSLDVCQLRNGFITLTLFCWLHVEAGLACVFGDLQAASSS